jgi:hypothetical protein
VLPSYRVQSLGTIERIHLCPIGQRYSMNHFVRVERRRSRYVAVLALSPHFGHFSSIASVLAGEKTEPSYATPVTM